MSKNFHYSLNAYIKAIEILRKKRYSNFIERPNKGTKHHFELYIKETDNVPHAMWNIHFGHDKKKTIWSKTDLKKAADALCITLEEFIEVIEEL